MKAFNFDEIREEIKQMREDVAEGMKRSPAYARMDSMFANMLSVVDESKKAKLTNLLKLQNPFQKE